MMSLLSRHAYVRRSILPASAILALLAVTACGRTDNDVRSDVQAQLAVDPDTAKDDLKVTVNQGVVTLSGDTRSHADQERAVTIARAVKGVKDVKSEMKLGDEGIADAVRAAIAKDPDVGRIPLKVESRNGVIWLTSDQTDKAQRDKLVALARPVDGVKDVVDNMR